MLSNADRQEVTGLGKFLGRFSPAFLCCWPVVVLCSFWQDLLAGWCGIFFAAACFVWVRVAGFLYAQKMSPSLSYFQPRNEGIVNAASLRKLQGAIPVDQ